MTRLTRDEFVREFIHTYPRHLGDVVTAAPIFNMKPQTLARRLHRARAAGYAVKFTDTSERASS